MTIYFYENTQMNGSTYIILRLRSSAVLNIEKDVKNCFLADFNSSSLLRKQSL